MSAVKGALGGLAIALIVLALDLYGIPQKYDFMVVPQFVASAPAYLTMRLNLTGIIMPIFFLVYWIFAGAVIAWWLDKPVWGKVIAFALIVALFYGHYHAMLLLGEKSQAALTEFGRIF